jgi:hypothetical protein
MEMVSNCIKIRGFASLTERNIGTGSPVIMQLRGFRL